MTTYRVLFIFEPTTLQEIRHHDWSDHMVGKGYREVSSLAEGWQERIIDRYDMVCDAAGLNVAVELEVDESGGVS